MIKLQRPPKPEDLTDELQKSLTDEFKRTKNAVWNKDFVKRALLALSHGKCCYCESNITEESKYMEVEHFYHKSKYPDLVMEWDNLLPSCKRCNSTKNVHDACVEPIIDPTKDTPQTHLRFWYYRIKGVDSLGRLTVSVLDLNNQDRLVQKRFEIGNAIQSKLERLNELLEEYSLGVQCDTMRKNRIVNGTKDLLREGLPASPYSATAATIMLIDCGFNVLKKSMESQNLWDEELTELENQLRQVALEHMS